MFSKGTCYGHAVRPEMTTQLFSKPGIDTGLLRMGGAAARARLPLHRQGFRGDRRLLLDLKT